MCKACRSAAVAAVHRSEDAMRPTMNRLIRPTLAAVVLLAGCGTSSSRYVSDSDAHSVTRGRITRVAGLNSQRLIPLRDGVVFVLSDPGCKLTIKFEDGKSADYEARAGDKLVCAKNADYYLQPQSTVELPE